jgi:hypothetical protein
VFFLIKLVLLPVWLPCKIIAEIVEHSGHRRHYRRRRRLRLIWLPGKAGLARWTSDVMGTVGAARRTPAQRFVVAPITVLAVILVWAVVVYAWLLWWVILALAVPVMALA